MGPSKDLDTILSRWIVDGRRPEEPSADDVAAWIAAAREQGLAVLLARSIPEGSAWKAARESLRAGAQRAVFTAVQQLDLAHRVQTLLLQKGLRALPLKGAALAETAYDSPGDRPMADVDILALDDPRSSATLLEEAGFRELVRADHAIAYRDPVTGVPLELHHSVTSCPGLFPLDVEGVWSRSRPHGGQVERVPSPEDLLLHLSMHASFQHGLVLSLVQYLDFRRVLERLSPDPERVWELAQAARAEAAVLSALAAAERVVGAPFPEGMRRHLANRPGLTRWLTRRLEGGLLHPAATSLASARWELARGHRVRLLRLTLTGGPKATGRSSTAWERMCRVARLAWHVAWSRT